MLNVCSISKLNLLHTDSVSVVYRWHSWSMIMHAVACLTRSNGRKLICNQKQYLEMKHSSSVLSLFTEATFLLFINHNYIKWIRTYCAWWMSFDVVSSVESSTCGPCRVLMLKMPVLLIRLRRIAHKCQHLPEIMLSVTDVDRIRLRQGIF